MVYSHTILFETPQNKNLEKFHLHSLYKCHKIINSKELFNIIQNLAPTSHSLSVMVEIVLQP